MENSSVIKCLSTIKLFIRFYCICRQKLKNVIEYDSAHRVYETLTMWFPLGIQNFIAKNITHDDCYELYISDFERIWHISVSNEELMSVSQRLNPLFEASIQKLKEIISNLFQDEKAEKEIAEENNNITLKLNSRSLGIKFLFQIVLRRQSEEIFYKEFTLPLLLVFIQMHNREKKLIKIITDKDAEIKEYKEECGVNKSNYMATKPFNKEEFESEESITSICHFNSFIECINLVVQSVKKEQLSYETLSDKSFPVSSQKFIIENRKAISLSTNNKNGANQCVKLEHQTIKRRKKENDAFKIKL